MKSEYWIHFGNEYELQGPFDKIHDAEKWIRNDSKESFLEADKSLRDMEGEWSTPAIILKKVKTVRPVPRVKVTVELRTAK